MKNSDYPMIVRDVSAGGFLWVNRTFSERLGWRVEDLVERSLIEMIVDADSQMMATLIAIGSGRCCAAHVGRDGEPMEMDWQIRAGDDGSVAIGVLAGCGGNSAATNPATTASVDPDQDTLSETLRSMALIIEDQHPGRWCSILLLDAEGRRVSVGAGPSLPDDYNSAVEGLLIGPGVGSCGTAAFWNQRVLVEDIQKESLWRDLKGYAARAGVAACWSHPIVSRTGEVLGALALYNPVPSSPSELELNGLETAARMVALAIERGRAEAALRRSESGARFQSRLLAAVTDVVTSFVDRNDWGTAASRLVQEAMALTDSASGFLGVIHDGSDAYGEVVVHGSLSPDEYRPLLAEVVANSSPVVCNDVPSDPRFVEAGPDSGCGLRNAIGVPIRSDGSPEGSVVAILWVGNGAGDRESGELESDELGSGDYGTREIGAVSVLCRAASALFDAYRRQEREAALEEHLRQAAKMEAIGVLAGGIAHDFNNMLAAVQGNAELALGMLPAGTEARGMLSEIVAASQKSSELCNQMLAYAGRGMRSVQKLDLGALVRELGDLQRVTLSKKGQLRYDLSDDALFVEADRAQMNQVVMNLISNAADALGDDEGRIDVQTTVTVLDQAELLRLKVDRLLDPGSFVRLTVADNGCGMNSEIRDRIFDPFFTTKFTGRGLGLAALRGIVRAHHGAIVLESEEGRGTMFTVLLPQCAAPEPAKNPGPISADASSDTEPVSGRSRILVVDDEPLVREVHIRILESAGFEVLRASDGQEAVEVFEREGDSIDCVLLDLSMPRLNGEEALRAMRALRSDVRAVLTSGFTEQEMLDRFTAAGFSGVVQKPTPKAVLLATIREALASP